MGLEKCKCGKLARAYTPRNVHECVQCGNPNHPDGAWHTATPYPITLVECIKQWWRKKKYGCGCEVQRK